MPPLYPFLLEPKEVSAIWGGDALVTRYGKKGDARDTLGESWECWDSNRVANGALAGATIAELRAQLAGRLLGDIDPSRIFPVLTKIIDARASLSVQVHPDDAYAREHEKQPNGKTECWYILAAEPGAELILGWTKDTNREEYERRVADGSLGDILRRVAVLPGDVFYLPAGTLHAIGAGIQLFETQQASDLTYRIFDWNRVGPDGKPRALHVAKAADVLDYRRGRTGAAHHLLYRSGGLQRTALVADSHFGVELVDVSAEGTLDLENRPCIVMATERRLTIDCCGNSADLAPYSTALLPAEAGRARLSSDGAGARALVVAPLRSSDQMRNRLLRAGVSAGEAERFLQQFLSAAADESEPGSSPKMSSAT